jgi:hypothetical protein
MDQTSGRPAAAGFFHESRPGNAVEGRKPLDVTVVDAHNVRASRADQQAIVTNWLGNKAGGAFESSNLVPTRTGVAHDLAPRDDGPRFLRASCHEADVASVENSVASLDVVDAFDSRGKDHRLTTNLGVSKQRTHRSLEIRFDSTLQCSAVIGLSGGPLSADCSRARQRVDDRWVARLDPG